jgi:hypothetical protein
MGTATTTARGTADPTTESIHNLGRRPDAQRPAFVSGGGRAEPAGEVVVQVVLIVTDPGDVAVGA